MLACERGLTDMLFDKYKGLDRRDLERAISHEKTRKIVRRHISRETIGLVKQDSLEPVSEKEMNELGVGKTRLMATDEALHEVGETVNVIVGK